MPFTVRDFQSLIRAPEQRAEWKAELRRVLLTEDLLTLPELVRALAAAQERTEARLAELAAAQQRTETRLAELAAAQQRTETRLAELAAAQTHLQTQMAELAAAQARTEAQVAELAQAHQRLERRVGRLEGHDLERRYRERAAGFFQTLLTRVRAIDHQELGQLLDDALEAGRITAEEKAEVLILDVVVRGRRAQQDAFVATEVSLERAMGVPVLPAVAGEEITERAWHLATASGVWCLPNGRAAPRGTRKPLNPPGVSSG